MIGNLLTLGRSAVRATRYLLDGRVRFPQDRLGDALELPDGNTFVVYRETALSSDTVPSGDGVVLVFRMEVTDPEAGETLREVLFDPFANVATPFFAGMPGFRRKLWLAGQRQGEFLELYEWASREDADRFVAVLESLLAPFDFAGSASFDVVEDDSVDEYVASRAVEWRDEDDSGTGLRDEDDSGTGLRERSVVLAVVVLCLVAAVVAYLLGKGWPSRGSSSED
ncbi:MAG: hypothetical protein ACI8XM_002599 [Haloarculaceae archaeon]|jgi:hypothetical protein